MAEDDHKLVEMALLYVLKDMEGVVVEQEGELIAVYRQKDEIYFTHIDDTISDELLEPGRLLWFHNELPH